VGTLKNQASSGVRWTTLSTVIVTVLQFIQMAALGRLLQPTAFGLMAMVTVVVGFAQVFGDMGISDALIQKKESTHEQFSSLYWLNIAFGITVFLIVWVLTPLIAHAFGAPELNELLPVVALSFPIYACASQFQTMMQKSLRFRLLALSQITAILFSVVVSIVGACFGLGVWSLVWGTVGGTIVRSAMYIRCGLQEFPAPKWHFSWSDVSGYLSFGIYRVGATSVNFFNSRIDQMLIGVLMGPKILGYYTIAVSLVLQPIQKLNPVLTQVAFPVFSRVQDDIARLKRGYLQMINFLMLVNAPILLGIAVVAPVGVPFLLGDKWYGAIALVQILALYAMIRSIGNASGSLILARGHANWTFYSNLALLLVIPPVVYLASLSKEVTYIAWSLVLLQFFLLFSNYWFFIRNILGSCFIPYIKAVGIPILLASAMSLVILAIEPLVHTLPAVVHLGFQILVGVVSYSLLVWVFQREFIQNIINLLPKKYLRFSIIKR
jgi:PST family polysaccharide transporter/teichuronic acid exporter/lipopolysaccharide exporter